MNINFVFKFVCRNMGGALVASPEFRWLPAGLTPGHPQSDWWRGRATAQDLFSGRPVRLTGTTPAGVQACMVIADGMGWDW